MNSIEAAIEILRVAGAPLRFEELTERMLSSGTWNTKGKTPAATVNAAIAVNIKQNGEFSLFVRVGRGVYGLREEGAVKHVVKLEPESEIEPLKDDQATKRKPHAPERFYSFIESAERVLAQFGGNGCIEAVV